MRTLSFALTLAAASAALPQASLAQGRPDTLSMSCAQAQGIVQQFGAAVLGTGPNVFDRYVRSQAFCTWNEQTRPAWVATRDVRQCFIGYRCIAIDIELRR